MSHISTRCEILLLPAVKYVTVPGWQNNSTRGAITTITTTLAAVNTNRANCSSSSIKLPRRRNSPNWPPRTISVKYLPLCYTPSANVTDSIPNRPTVALGDLKQYETMMWNWKPEKKLRCRVPLKSDAFVLKNTAVIYWYAIREACLNIERNHKLIFA